MFAYEDEKPESAVGGVQPIGTHLLPEPSLLRVLATGGRKTAEERFGVNLMVSELKNCIMKVDEKARVN